MPLPSSRRNRRAVAPLVLAVAVMFAAPAVPAASGGIADLETPDGIYATTQSNGKTLSEAVEQVRRQYGGRIISAETRRQGDREVHVIKVLTRDNKVKTVRVSGRQLSRG
jgi:uncharacterized membrane protein YkoI